MMILLAYVLSAVLIFFDQITKILIKNWIPLGQSVTIIPGFLDFHSTYNTGAAFSFFSGKLQLLSLISILATIVLAYFMKDVDFRKKKLFSFSMVLIFSGTVGNLIDRLFTGKGVFDFIEVTFVEFAIFNVADSCLTVGVILLMVYMVFFESKNKPKATEVGNDG
ncbi:MAG: signal peptidase II [Bacilli bacterium]|jgi:signal peptidase II|nr:signal peptidase II [Bacilli bacterium]HHU24676.1 signal peptidase II [Acholeplasmataceae bacterium]